MKGASSLSLALPLSLSGEKRVLLYLSPSQALCLTTVQSLFSAALSAGGKWRERVGETGSVCSTPYAEVLFQFEVQDPLVAYDFVRSSYFCSFLPF